MVNPKLSGAQVASAVVTSVLRMLEDNINERYPIDMFVLAAFCSLFNEAEEQFTAEWLTQHLDPYLSRAIVHKATLAAALALAEDQLQQPCMPKVVLALQTSLCIANDLAVHTTFIANLLQDGVDAALLIKLDQTTNPRYYWSEAGRALCRDFSRLHAKQSA